MLLLTKLYNFCIIFIIFSDIQNSAGDNYNLDTINYFARSVVFKSSLAREPEVQENYELVSSIPSTNLNIFAGYRVVSLQYFSIPEDVGVARFSFSAETIHVNTIGSCQNGEVEVYIKHGSYPAVIADGLPFPSHFINETSRTDNGIHGLEFVANTASHNYSIDNPRAGDWFVIAFLKWVDPQNARVGLTAVCRTVLSSDLQVQTEDIGVINCHTEFSIHISSISSNIYKCKLTNQITPLSINVNVNSVVEDTGQSIPRIGLRINADSIPNSEHNILYCYMNTETNYNLTFTPFPSSWHFFSFEYVNVSDNLLECGTISVEHDEVTLKMINLIRKTEDAFFNFGYSFPLSLQNSSDILSIVPNELYVLKFDVLPMRDIGGFMGLEFGLSGLPDYDYRVVICMSIDHFRYANINETCNLNNHVDSALVVLNQTNNSVIGTHYNALIPYPKTGTWYFSLRLFAHDVNVVGGMAANITFSLNSESCAGGCSNRGTCVLRSSGGLILSTCSCNTGHGALDCSDDSRRDSYATLLIEVLLLTLSNLFFILSIYIAIKRKYYTEAVMYNFTMLFSLFYHACDVPAEVQFCVFSFSVLQFGDFYSGNISIVVTLLAMSILKRKLHMSLILISTVLCACLLTWNRFDVLTFVAPISVGVLAIIISWTINYRQKRSLYFKKLYYVLFLPIGLVLTIISLMCFAFLQTEQNYKYVHSTWHVLVALSIVFLLPDQRPGSVVHGGSFSTRMNIWYHMRRKMQFRNKCSFA